MLDVGEFGCEGAQHVAVGGGAVTDRSNLAPVGAISKRHMARAPVPTGAFRRCLRTPVGRSAQPTRRTLNGAGSCCWQPHVQTRTSPVGRPEPTSPEGDEDQRSQGRRGQRHHIPSGRCHRSVASCPTSPWLRRCQTDLDAQRHRRSGCAPRSTGHDPRGRASPAGPRRHVLTPASKRSPTRPPDPPRPSPPTNALDVPRPAVQPDSWRHRRPGRPARWSPTRLRACSP